jgi:hypothetical protein
MYSTTAILSVTASFVFWAVCVRGAVRREGVRVLWIAWIPPGIVVAIYGMDLLLGLACATGGGCV